MELQSLTEELLQVISVLSRARAPMDVQENLKGERFLLSYLASQQGESTPGDLRVALGVSAPRTAAMLRTLEGKGLLQRRISGADKRRIVVTITEDGLALALRRRRDLSQRVHTVLEQLGERDTQEFIRILGRIAEIENRCAPGKA